MVPALTTLTVSSELWVHCGSRPGSAPSSSHAPPAQATPRASRQPFACTSVEITVPKRLPFLTLSHPPRWPSCSLPFSTDSALPTYPSATERSRGRAAQALTPQLCSLSVAARPLFASASPGPFRRSTAPFRGRPSPCPAHRHDRTAGAPPLLCPVPPVPRTRPGPARLLPRRLSPLEAPARAGPPFWLNRRSSVKHALAADRLAKMHRFRALERWLRTGTRMGKTGDTGSSRSMEEIDYGYFSKRSLVAVTEV
ncbi:translation initiation factor IF-2-like [Marmota marmota marmota]|uniref:translation initiation factor IF-2-like n=1 Tax=Marmota marmota marmota TaxID=9994 RepID=UPI00076251D6|nr:translation initiation factor IF-2-like [Marmota marmota marmota]